MAGGAGGAFTGLYQGGGGAASASAALKPLLPNISVYQQGASTAAPLQAQVTAPPQSFAGGSNLDKFGAFLGDIGKETGNIATGAATWLAKGTMNVAEAPVKLTADYAHAFLDNQTLDSINAQNQQISARISTLNKSFKAGQITSAEYKKGASDISQDADNLVRQSNGVSHNINLTQQSAVNDTINTAAGIITVMTAGLGAAPLSAVGINGAVDEGATSAGAWLASKAAQPVFDASENLISKVATDSKAFKALDSVSQWAVQHSTAEVVSSAGTTMTAGQIARATVTNLALKYPLFYSYTSSTAHQVYQELDQKKYGNAVRSVAFNAAMLLSGGPIGHALKYGGDVLKTVSSKTFGQTSFWDELSKFYGDGNAEGFSKAISTYAEKLSIPERADFVRNLGAVEATNVHAMGGDPIAAAYRVAKGMQGQYAFDLSKVPHDQAIDDMVKFAKNFRTADAAAQKAGLGNIAIGRLDARDKSAIAEAIVNNGGNSVPSLADSGETTTKSVESENKPQNASAQLPRELQGAKPNYNYGQNHFSLSFQDDTTKALYVVAQAGKSSKDEDYMSFLRNALPDKSDSEIRSLGQQVKDSIKSEAKTSASDTINVKSPLPDEAQSYASTFGVNREQAASELRSTTNATEASSQPTTTSDSAQGIPSQLQHWEGWKQINPNSAAANNANFDTQIKQLIEQHGDNPNELAKNILGIKARTQVEGFPDDVARQLAKEGYVPIKPKNLEAPFKEGSGTLTTKFAGNNDFFTKAVQPLPVLGSVGSWLTGMGLSPNSSTNTVYEMFNDNLARNLQATNAFKKLAFSGASDTETTDTIVKQLSDYAHGSKLPIKDLRQLTYRQIGKALDIGADDAKEVQNAITDAHLQVPLAFRGLGDSAVDWSYKLPGSAPVMRQYMKLQGALRFTFNPFFQYLRVIPKTEILTQAEGGGYVNSIFAGRASQIPGVRSALRDGGFFDTAGHLRGGDLGGGEAEGIVTSVSRNISKHLLPMQERSIAGLVDSQAQRMGMDTSDYIQAHPEQVRDTVQGIAEYDRKGNFINSPLARTLNIAFFPFRFDAKVATIFAKSLAKSSLLTQVSVINGVMRGHDFLTSPEGKAWYAQNSDAIGLINYITPLASMADVFSSLMPGHDHSLGNFGELGGLPFGWIPQLLDSEGLTQFNQPGVDAKTGQMIPSYVPATAKGQLAIAVQDLLGELFSYPGAEVGLQSKNSITRNAALGITGANKNTDLKLTTPEPNAQQQANAEIIGGKSSVPQPMNTSANPTGNQTVTSSSTTADIQGKVASSTKAKVKKKSDYTPELLPGQSQLGVIPGT